MRTLILILLLSVPAGLFAQDRYIEISEVDAPALKQYKINWHTGIDPVQIKDGRWVLPEKVLPLIPAKIKVSVDEKEVTADLKAYLEAQNVVSLEKTDFKEATLEAEEPKGTEIIR